MLEFRAIIALVFTGFAMGYAAYVFLRMLMCGFSLGDFLILLPCTILLAVVCFQSKPVSSAFAEDPSGAVGYMLFPGMALMMTLVRNHLGRRRRNEQL